MIDDSSYDFIGELVVATLTGLPTGPMVVSAKLQVATEDDPLGDTQIDCRLHVGTDFSDDAAARFILPGRTTLPFLVAADLPATGPAMLVCNCISRSVCTASHIKIVATQLDSLIRVVVP